MEKFYREICNAFLKFNRNIFLHIFGFDGFFSVLLQCNLSVWEQQSSISYMRQICLGIINKSLLWKKNNFFARAHRFSMQHLHFWKSNSIINMSGYLFNSSFHSFTDKGLTYLSSIICQICYFFMIYLFREKCKGL